MLEVLKYYPNSLRISLCDLKNCERDWRSILEPLRNTEFNGKTPQIIHLFIGFSMKFSPSILG